MACIDSRKHILTLILLMVLVMHTGGMNVQDLSRNLKQMIESYGLSVTLEDTEKVIGACINVITALFFGGEFSKCPPCTSVSKFIECLNSNDIPMQFLQMMRSFSSYLPKILRQLAGEKGDCAVVEFPSSLEAICPSVSRLVVPDQINQTKEDAFDNEHNNTAIFFDEMDFETKPKTIQATSTGTQTGMTPSGTPIFEEEFTKTSTTTSHTLKTDEAVQLTSISINMSPGGPGSTLGVYIAGITLSVVLGAMVCQRCYM